MALDAVETELKQLFAIDSSNNEGLTQDHCWHWSIHLSIALKRQCLVLLEKAASFRPVEGMRSHLYNCVQEARVSEPPGIDSGLMSTTRDKGLHPKYYAVE